MRFAIPILVILLVSSVVKAEEVGKARNDVVGDVVRDKATGLIIAEGWELVSAHCGVCHSHALVTGQSGDRETWLEIIRWMQSTQNLWQFDPESEASMLDYLAKNYPPKVSSRRAPLANSLRPH